MHLITNPSVVSLARDLRVPIPWEASLIYQIAYKVKQCCILHD